MTLNKIEKAKWKPRNSIEAEHKRQKTDTRTCRHLKGTYKKTVTLTDRENDRLIDVEVTACKHCDKDLTDEELEQIKIDLKKFKNK